MKKTFILTVISLMLGINIFTPSFAYAYSSYNQLGASCYSTYSSADVGDDVFWRTTPYGGDGNYNITWSGSDGLNGNGTGASINYRTSGSKTAMVTITSDGQSLTKNCTNIEIYNSDNNSNNTNYNYNSNNNYDSNINNISCYPSNPSANVSDNIVWRISNYGGTNYNITWSGSDGLNGNGTSVNFNYYNPGTKTASITLTSGNQVITKSCGNVEIYRSGSNYNNYYNNNNNYNNTPLIVSCFANTSFAPVGTRASWQSNVSGGNGYYSYSWYGSDNIFGSDRVLETIYNSPGTKTASVTVRSGDQNITQTCSSTILVGSPTNTYNNQYTQPAPVYVAPTTVPETVIKYIYLPAEKEEVENDEVEEVVEEPTESVVEPVVIDNASNNDSLFSSTYVPWGWVSVFVIVILLFTVIYLVYSKKS